ncbi:unnamed protein product [Adineta steineri]|uniref:Reverse transcriptase domain-containing protein n=1 Tax=Adineta steineri TaxID=433720 RepID=A0A819S5M9_9BILA|nr:unnamed protein product [Adineta steineri]
MKRQNILINHVSQQTNDNRLPTYLRKAPNLLFQALRLKLTKKINTTSQQRFLHHRLQLIDQQYRLDLHQNLWQSYLSLGSEHEIWANQVYKLANSNDHEQCQHFVTNRLIELNRQIDQCTAELITQSRPCPKKLLPIEELDCKLKEFVSEQQTHLVKKINARLIRYQDMIEEKKLFQILSTYTLTNIQKDIIDRLINLRQKQLEVFEELLQFETQVSMELLPEDFDHLEMFIAPTLYSSIVKDHLLTMTLKQKRYKTIQEIKRIWLNIYIDAYEIQYQDYEHQYKRELDNFKLISANDNQINEATLPIDSFMTYINHRTKRMKQEIYSEKLSIYRRKLLRRHRRRLGLKTKLIPIRPTVIIDLIRHPFTTTELAYLSRGPTYIRPNQSALRPAAQREKQIDKESTTIIDKLKRFMANLENPGKIPSTARLYKSYLKRLRAHLFSRYMTPLTLIDQIRARREFRMVKSIQRKLKKYRLILRQTDKSGVFHIGHANDYKRKARQYREKTGAYEELPTNPFNEILYNTTHLLNQMKAHTKIPEWQRLKMLPVQAKTQLAYQYFLPKVHKNGTPLRPIINTIHAATKAISQFLDRMIRPLFDRYVRQTTIVDGVDLLTKLQIYIQQGHFTASTLFVTFDITNLYTMLPQEESLKILAEFLREHHSDRLNGISIETIIELSRIVLQANAFIYDNKFYRQIIGGAMGSPFTLTLANIFMWKWEKQALIPKLLPHEIFGRYIDDGFFTSNESEATIKAILNIANKFHPNIKLEYQIGKCLPFLDVLIHNNNGILSSSVYHKPAAEPAVLSFLSDHPRHTFRNVLQTLLIRAIRYSSTFEAFNIERREIRLLLLYNGYPSTYIHEQFQQFFMKHRVSSSSSTLPLIDNEQEFYRLRENLSAQPSIKQEIVKKNAATVEITTKKQANQETTTQIMETRVKRKNDDKFKNTIFIHCIHEARLEGVKRHIHEIHDSYFKSTDHGNIRLVVGHRNNPNLDFELTNKRPRSTLLKDPTKKSKDGMDLYYLVYQIFRFSFLLEPQLNQPAAPPPQATA